MFLSYLFLVFLILQSRKYKQKSYIYIYSVWFLIVLFDYMFFQEIFVPFSEKFDLFFLYFSFLFSFAYLLFDEIITRAGELVTKKINLFSYRAYRLFSVMLGFLSIALCLKAFSSMSILAVRAKLAAKELSFHVGISFPFVASCVFFQNIKNEKKYCKFLAILMFLLALISSSKQFIILSFLFYIPWYKAGFKIKLIYIVFTVLVGFLLVLILHAVTGRVAGSGNLVQKTLYTINGYFLGGLAVFQLFLDGTMSQHITTGAWIKTGEWVGNVYSGFYSFYENNNVALLTFKILCISLLYAAINIRRKSIFSQFMRVYSVYPLIFFVFSDLFFAAISQWIMFSIAGLGITFIKDKSRRTFLV